MVFDEAGDINDGVDPQHEVDQVIIDICKEIDDFAELDHLVDDIKNIVDLELESDKAAEELATISDEHHVREAGELLLHLVGCCNIVCIVFVDFYLHDLRSGHQYQPCPR